MSELRNEENVVDVKFQKYTKKFRNAGTVIVFVILLIIVGFNSVYILQDGKAGVVLRFGKVSTVERNAGFHTKLPFVDQVRVVDVANVYKMDYGFRTTRPGTETTQPVYVDFDEEAQIIVDAANNNASIALINLSIQYRINDPVNYLFKVDDVEGTLRLALENAIRNTYQQYTLDDARSNKEFIDNEIRPPLQKKLDNYGAGIQIVAVKTQNIELLPAVQEAYRQKENATQYKIGKLEEAEKYYNTVIPQANAEATQLIEGANGYKAEVIANANASVAQFEALYAEFLKNPDIIKERYYIEAMGALITNNNVIIDAAKDSDIYKFYNFDENDMIKEKIANKE